MAEEKKEETQAADEQVTDPQPVEDVADNQPNVTEAESNPTSESKEEPATEEVVKEETGQQPQVADKVAEDVPPSEETPKKEAAAEDTATKSKEEKPKSKSKPKTVAKPRERKEIKPLEDFDWGALGKDDDLYSQDEREKMEKLYGDTLTSIVEHSVLDGTVVNLTRKEVVINIGYKSEGVIQRSEFRYNAELKEGDTVEVYVENQEDRDGQLVLSHRKARTLRAWERVNRSLEEEEVIEGHIKCRTKGGLIVDVFGLEAFLPGSQIDVKPIRDFDLYVGKNMEFKVVKINQEFKNVVVSHKALIEAELEQQKAEIMSKLEKGQVLEGTVKNITSYGVFIDLGGVDGLIHITDLSWGRINHPEEIVELDQKLNVVILDFDDDKKRIALGLKQLTEHPWDSLDDSMKIGDKVKGKVVVLADYGAFVEISTGVEGLIHVSEMSWSQHLRSAQDFFKVADKVEAVIMTLDREERKMSLSTRRLTPDPWDGIDKKYPAESKHKGRVTNISNFGVFVELEEGIDGLVHISDLSWSKRINHPSEFTKVGETIEVVVLEIDLENRRLSLGHKQLEDNPWDTYESIFSIGSLHKGTVINRNDKGGVVELPHGVEGYAPGRHLIKEDGKKVEADEQIEFMIIEFSKESKKIIVSHTQIHSGERDDSNEQGKRKKKSKAKSTGKSVKQVNEQVEKTTLGDLGVLSELKSEMEEDEAGGKGSDISGKSDEPEKNETPDESKEDEDN